MEERKIYTDIVLEAAETLSAGSKGSMDGVEIETSEIDCGVLTWVRVTNEKGAKALNKPVGNYVTIESQSMREGDVDAHEMIIAALADAIGKLKKKGNGDVLVVGLGNIGVTPDALGPKVVSKTFVTRYITDKVPDEEQGKTRPVAAISPGVMGTTGIETREIVKGVCDKISPSLVIVIDALAARKTSRVNATIQLSDTGLSPGGGMGNSRGVINEEFLGTQVIAIGVPTVVDAATLVSDSLDLLINEMMDGESEKESPFYKELSRLSNQEKYTIVRGVLEPYAGNMFVTPKEVDEVIGRLSNIIANAINVALHEGITLADINRFMY
ncbi:germination protease [Clostridia bacterium]|nr:germination protease [Clostridia bacterium]